MTGPYVKGHADEVDEEGLRLVVRNSHARPPPVTLGCGTVEVSALRVNDRRTDDEGARQRFTSEILPPYMRRSPKVDEILPVLYLRGLSTGDFQEALPILMGEQASGLSPTAITRLTNAWNTDYEAFCKRSLADRDFVYVWADGVHFRIRLEHFSEDLLDGRTGGEVGGVHSPPRMTRHAFHGDWNYTFAPFHGQG